MKIEVYYEDKRSRRTVEVPDEECRKWEETDYRQRLAAAADKSAVRRRTAQEIMDEECNRPTYNNEVKETRRHMSLETLDPMGDTLVGDAGRDPGLPQEGYDNLYEAIGKLTPGQRELLQKIFWEKRSQREVAEEEGVDESAISRRLARIYARLKKVLTE